MEAPQHPGTILKARFLDPLEITPYRLAKCLGVHLTRISRIIRGERAVTPDTAARLGRFFGVPAEWWLEMQSAFDLQTDVDLEAVNSEVQPFDRPPNCAIGRTGVRLFSRSEGTGDAVVAVGVSDALVEKLRRQVELDGKIGNRRTHMVDYGNGYRAIVGMPE